MDRHDTLLLSCGMPESRGYLRSILEGSFHLLEAANSQQTLLLLEQNIDCIAAVLLDVTRRELIDRELLLRQGQALLSRVPVIMLTENDSPEILDQCFASGATDVIPLNYEPYALQCRIHNIVQLHIHKQNLEALVAEQTGILRHSNEAMVDALSSIIEYRSAESGQHILRIRRFTRVLLEEVAKSNPGYSLTDELIAIISSAAALHDIGKIAIPDAILTKPAPLTPEERTIMQTHTTVGCRILETLREVGNEEYLRYAWNICRYHHERWDGGGYPEGLSGSDIPLCAQVVGLADVYDALTTKRVYKDAYDLDVAVNMIISGECGVFSPELLECFKRVAPRYQELSRAYADGLSPSSEVFSTPLPKTSGENDSMNTVNGKYQTLLHYINAFVLELFVDQGIFHLRYNPYPELGAVNNASSFADLETIVMELVAGEDRQKMAELIHSGIEEFLQAGLRRQSFRFRLGCAGCAEELYEVTLLRAKVNQAPGSRSMAVLCRKIPEDRAPAPFPEEAVMDQQMACCVCNDRDLTLVHLGSAAAALLGCDLARSEGTLLQAVHPEDRQTLRETLRQALQTGTVANVQFRTADAAGTVRWLLGRFQLALTREGQELLHCRFADISPVKQSQEQLQQKLERYEIILAQTENTLFDWDVVNDVAVFSDTWETFFGFAPISGGVWKSLSGGAFFHPDDVPLLHDRIRAIEKGSPYEMLEVRIVSARGRYIWCRIRASAIRDDQGELKRIVGLIINIDTEKQAERALQDRADRDPLTRLLNKSAGRRQAEEYLSQFSQGMGCALMIIDLDNFKTVNDSYGHLFGDTVLTKASREIRKLFRAQDIVARIGGDEFMVLLRGVSDRALVESRCSRLLTTFANVFGDEQYRRLPISCSIGIALAPEHGTSYVDLFRCADQALYCAKDRGKNTYVIYDPADSAQALRSTRRTAVSLRIDSDEQPEMAQKGIVQYAFQRLYSSSDVDASIAELLELVGRQTNVSRVYVFENSPDNRECSNTYEWCNTGISPEKENLQHVSYITDIPGYEENFDENGIFYCPDVTALPKNVYDILAPQGIKSMLQCAIRDNGVFRGYIGFDECVAVRLWTREQIDLLSLFSDMLSVFLLKLRGQEKIARRAQELHGILDSQNAWIFVVDPDTMELKYLNARARQSVGDARAGMLCHRSLRGLESPCPGCPMKQAGEESTCCILTDSVSEKRYLAETAPIRWEDLPARLMTYREISVDGKNIGGFSQM